MIALRRSLAAEWLRISRRWDVWLVGALVVGASAWLYVSAFLDSTGVMGVGEHGGWGSGEGLPPPAWFLDAMLGLRGPYAFPRSLLTVLDSAWLLPVFGAYITVVTIGPDFWWGTMRSILVTQRSRLAYLGQRLFMVSILVLCALLTILAVAIVAQVALVTLAGERFPAGSLDIGTFAGMVGARLVAILGYTVAAAVVTLVARSLAGGIVLLTTVVAGELAAGALATSAGWPVVKELTFSGALSSIVDQLRPRAVELVVDYEASALVPAAHQPPPVIHVYSIEGSAAVAVTWVVLLVALAVARMRSMDITD